MTAKGRHALVEGPRGRITAGATAKERYGRAGDTEGGRRITPLIATDGYDAPGLNRLRAAPPIYCRRTRRSPATTT
ncbi:hypothetical protein GTY65_09255 [Streptomyces sp. SID8379]|uniref:hypothetical protein n=1 Tax=unclassified Streptomyces TaxID=2593676 RepID=UPI00131A4355|nr:MULTISPECIES: hypothetical protein [unclassified Streptomyces]MYW64259.1 hypothetical protein [Streptomyces sp. SID8379]